MVGKSLSHYKILEELGRGGMGIVYRAEDTKLDRTVAIKVLPSAALASEDDRARFYREAKAAAQLHHPHIASIFEIDEAVPRTDEEITRSEIDDAVPSDVPHLTEPSPFIAMEFIEGETLHDRIQTGPLKLEQAVRIAREVASALDAAHRKGIVHRDIKAANIMLTDKGSAKVLDFGLAQTAQSTKLTQMGSTLGTIAYMSPEQARGEEVDLKTDLWSLGAVLYEMISGRSPFPGDYEQAVVYEILNQDPEPLTAVRTGVPMDLEAVVNKCLAKDSEFRYPSAEALIVDLKRIEASSAVRTTKVTTQTSTIAAVVPGPAPTAKLPWMPLAAAGVVLLVAGFIIGKVVYENEPIAKSVVRAQLNLPNARSPLEATITPDDRALFYVITDPEDGQRRLARYDFETGERRILPQTERAVNPVASPDGRWIAFRKSGINQWWRIAVSGGDPFEIPGARSALNAWATYAPNGDLVFPDSSFSIAAVDVAGSVRLIASGGSDGVAALLFGPASAPSGNFITWSDFPSFTPAGSWILHSGSSEPEKLIDGALIRAITTSGHALFTRGRANIPQQMIAVPIDLESGKLLGQEAPIGVWSSAVSPSGLLVYEDLSSSGAGEPSQLYRVSASGSKELLLTLPGSSSQEFAVSIDGSMLAISARPETAALPAMYLVDLSTGTDNRLTREGFADIPTWSGGGEYLFFDYQESGGGSWILMRRRADGSGVNEPVLPDGLVGGDPDVTPDGRLLVYSAGLHDIWGLDIAADTAFAIVVDDGDQSKPAVSPDGRFVVYVQGNPCGSIQVSAIYGSSVPSEITTRGCFPVWTNDGSYIYYQDESTVSRVPVTTEPVFNKLGSPEEIFTTEIRRPVPSDGGLFFDVATDGTLYVSYAPITADETRPIWVVTNWFEELNRIAPRSD
ncbi:MAG: hypothetical protein BMS9Abin05_1574 [Rhodothermia bacterium]|nr:MAG: hypothetical protein BMS9Abin05_1574 [Rhodothermia bacterium]